MFELGGDRGLHKGKWRGGAQRMDDAGIQLDPLEGGNGMQWEYAEEA